MKKIDLLKRDLEDMENYILTYRCKVCGHLAQEGWCCMECAWNGEDKDIKSYKKEYKERKKK